MSARLGFLLAMSAPLLGNGGCPTDDDDSADDLFDAEAWCAENPDRCDYDGDGLMGNEDCDDSDPLTHAGADELPYDGVDQNCDGEDLVDVDGDGVDATQAGGTDCDDGDPTVYPGAEEVCDGADQDCDGEEDEEEDLAEGEPEWGPDQNGDGLPECENPIRGCEAPEDIVVDVPGGQPIRVQYLSCDEEGLAQ